MDEEQAAQKAHDERSIYAMIMQFQNHAALGGHSSPRAEVVISPEGIEIVRLTFRLGLREADDTGLGGCDESFAVEMDISTAHNLARMIELATDL